MIKPDENGISYIAGLPSERVNSGEDFVELSFKKEYSYI